MPRGPSVYFFLYLPEPEDANWRTKLRRIDFLGAFALVASVFSLLLGLDCGSSISWASTLTIVLLCASAVLFLGFGFVEAKVATEPFAPGRIIFERSLLACYLCNFFSFGGWFAVIFYLPLYYQAVDGLSAAESGTRLIPAIIAGVAGSLFAGFVMKKTGRYYALIIAAYMGLLWGSPPPFACRHGSSERDDQPWTRLRLFFLSLSYIIFYVLVPTLYP